MDRRGIWIAALLLFFREGDGPPPAPEATYLGLTAVIYHLVGMYGGLVCILVASVAPDRWFRRLQRALAEQDQMRTTRTD